LIYFSYFIVDDERCKSIFKIGSVEKLLLEIKKKLNLNLDTQNLRSGNSVHDILESDMYRYGVGCEVILFWVYYVFYNILIIMYVFDLYLVWSTVLN